MMQKQLFWVCLPDVCSLPPNSKHLLLRAELSLQVQETQEEATPKEDPEAHRERVHDLLRLTKDAKENVDSLNEATR